MTYKAYKKIKVYKVVGGYRIGNLEFYKNVYPKGYEITFKEFFIPRFTRTLCTCFMFELAGFGVTWLRSECRKNA